MKSSTLQYLLLLFLLFQLALSLDPSSLPDKGSSTNLSDLNQNNSNHKEEDSSEENNNNNKIDLSINPQPNADNTRPSNVGNAFSCDFCYFLISLIDTYITENSTEEEIAHIVAGICNYIPANYTALVSNPLLNIYYL